MRYEDLVRDFASRTRSNLQLLRKLHEQHPDFPFYEFTQLVNSLLGLLVFPQQEYVEHIPKTPVEALKGDGWPVPTPLDGHRQVEHLNQLIRYLRNAIAHCNIVVVDQSGEITGLELWNERDGKVDWRVRLTKEEIESIANKLTELLLADPTSPTQRGKLS